MIFYKKKKKKLLNCLLFVLITLSKQVVASFETICASFYAYYGNLQTVKW